MFTLSGLILEVGKIYFGIFGVRLVSLLFVFLRVIIKIMRTDSGPYPSGTPPGAAFIRRPPEPASPPAPQPASSPAPPHARRRSLAAAVEVDSAAGFFRKLLVFTGFRLVFLDLFF